MRITAKHPVRAALAALDNYHDSKGCAARAVDEVFEAHDLCVDWPPLNGPDGYVTCPIRPAETGQVVCDHCARKLANKVYDNCVVFAWYTMPSGRTELTVYIS